MLVFGKECAVFKFKQSIKDKTLEGKMKKIKEIQGLIILRYFFMLSYNSNNLRFTRKKIKDKVVEFNFVEEDLLPCQIRSSTLRGGIKGI